MRITEHSKYSPQDGSFEALRVSDYYLLLCLLFDVCQQLTGFFADVIKSGNFGSSGNSPGK